MKSLIINQLIFLRTRTRTREKERRRKKERDKVAAVAGYFVWEVIQFRRRRHCFLSGISRSRRHRRFVFCFRPLGCPEKICKNKSAKVLHSLA